ncbi:WW domain-containing protein [Phytophthora infestans]|uniref:WW domain-containing protein n=1 Tax=Phytophthora infestans TaxID=4787 RepID=A0A8S9UJ70_PHYIN|nr:WW domain-containing protein [Phytophthora infestans]
MTTTSEGSDEDAEWEKHVDEATGSMDYYNARTDESSWEVPAGFNSPQKEDASQDKAPKWLEFVDDESGATYYFDKMSGTSRWDKPDDFIPEQESRDQEKYKKTEKQEEESEAPEQEPQEEKEEESTGDNDGSDEKKTKDALEDNAADAKAQHWVKYVDAASNKPYFHDASTGKTQWEEPEDFEEPATPVGTQVSAEYQAHLKRMQTEHLARVTQQVLDPSGNLSKLNAILSGIDSSAPSTTAIVDGEGDAATTRTAKAAWQQHVDAQTQRYYYHNVVTGVTQWNKPNAPVVSGLAKWIPPEVPELDSSGPSQKTVSGVNYVAQAKFNRLTGKYEQLGGDEYWQSAGMASDRAGRQMSHFFDMSELEKNREEARRRKEQLKRKNIDWKKITAEKKAKKQKQRNEWLYTD